jgi:prophage antirepressor-like protein
MSRKNQGKGDDVAGLPTVFQFGESSVRTVVKDGDPWFVAKDVCEILDLEDPSVTVSRLDDDQRGKANVCTPGGEQQMLTVSESGLYSLIFTSRKPEAKRFRKWIASEVLPEIRKTGGYGRPEPEFEALSGEYVDYKRWLLERALLDAKLIALSMQAVGSHFSRMVTDHPKHGEARSVEDFADFEREVRQNVHRSRAFINRLQPGSYFNHGPKPVEPFEPTQSRPVA